jgi:hypothetical protein
MDDIIVSANLYEKLREDVPLKQFIEMCKSGLPVIFGVNRNQAELVLCVS